VERVGDICNVGSNATCRLKPRTAMIPFHRCCPKGKAAGPPEVPTGLVVETRRKDKEIGGIPKDARSSEGGGCGGEIPENDSDDEGKGGKDWTVYILRCGDGSFYTG
jgi:hypothetical protein